jgi:DNA-binding FadR family transcriptional regulator
VTPRGREGAKKPERKPERTRRRPRRDEPRTLTTLQDEIKQLILDRDLARGDALPTEAELVDLLGVGRNSVREALKSLQALDLVEIRHGYGTYVGAMSLEPLADGLTFRTLHGMRDSLRSLTELLELREEMEAGLIRRVAPIATPELVAELDRTVDRMDAALRRNRATVEQDGRFHQTLYTPLGNELATQLLETLWMVYHRLMPRLQGMPKPTDLIGSHRAIVDGLRAHDPQRAEHALRVHFGEIHQRIERTRQARRERGEREAGG